ILPLKRADVLLFFSLFHADSDRFQKTVSGGALNFSFNLFFLAVVTIQGQSVREGGKGARAPFPHTHTPEM
ncbi:MAG: hypothetical protein LBS32_08370, partial [Clostridiales Family XIII bacterium]|nr:hypothetical protein [Clostridiales Family XIII bacterium]